MNTHKRRKVPGSLLFLFCLAGFGVAGTALASAGAMSLTNHWVGYLCLLIFAGAYALVIAEEALHLRKSKPMMVAAGVIWALVAIVVAGHGEPELAGQAATHNLLEFGELFLFLLVAMTYINAMDERGVFDALRVWLVSQGFSLRTIYWITGIMAFVISPIADNLTTALLMATVAMAVGGSNTRFVTVACINIVVAANAGGAFSPFGDITTLMVWQKGILPFQAFFQLLLPSIVNWIIPALIMFTVVPSGKPPGNDEVANLLPGAKVITGLFLLTIVMAVSSHNFLHMPPVLGMMLGLGILKIYAYFLQNRGGDFPDPSNADLGEQALDLETSYTEPDTSKPTQFNIFKSLERAEWDTLMFFYGIILCVGGLGTLGYLELASGFMYGDLGATTANIIVGILSALIDNIPVMFAVLSMLPEMDDGQWLLVTLTAGVGGSLLSVGSAAGVAVMGQARGVYTFFAHLKWSWAIMLGYVASIATHFWINGDLFT
jgi:Na+/H+ antiporter NhaD/arsenite permease-like protein